MYSGMGDTAFQSVNFVSFYQQYSALHGRVELILTFYSDAGSIVLGVGVDAVGSYVINGIYSSRS